ncbi:biotin/lipoate A/B protein ligase family protein [Rothia terrae]|uniref:lipoate--protein ligase family protein n=1 Tax=Rothia terrae TaxID=396015 RepID=UPI003810B7C4
MNTNSFHFEYKVPGGKLLVADVTVEDTIITSTLISGDYFLEPEEAFDDMTQALVDASTKDSADELKNRLDASLAKYGESLALHGFSTADVALVVKRAVSGAKDFTDYEWEVLNPGPLPSPLNVALDQYLLEEVQAGRRGPTMRIWDWEDRAVVFGSYQSYQNEINQEGVEKHGIQAVRRISGGGAMFMEAGNCVTYSLYLPEELVAGLSYEQSYEYLDQWVLAALKKLGVNAWYQPINDITSDNGKIGGAAQKRINGAVLHHVTMSYDIDADKMMDVLRIGKVKIVDKGIRSAKKRVDPLRRQTGATREEVVQTLIDTFTSRYASHMGKLSEADLAAGQKLVDEKFSTEQWRHRVP